MVQTPEATAEGTAGDGRCPLCRTELSAHDVVAAPVPAPALALVSDGDSWDPADPASPRRLVCTSPRRQSSVSTPRRGEDARGAAGEEPILLATDDVAVEEGSLVGNAGFGWSTKLQAILDELDFVNREHPGEKVVIFSQFTSFLDILQAALKVRQCSLDNGWGGAWGAGEGGKVARLDGSMTRAKRSLAMAAFTNDADTDVLLVSIKAGGTGLNLVSANHVFITDLWWNSAVEAQVPLTLSPCLFENSFVQGYHACARDHRLRVHCYTGMSERPSLALSFPLLRDR